MPERPLQILAEFTQIIIDPFVRDELLDQLIGHTLATLDAGAAGLMRGGGATMPRGRSKRPCDPVATGVVTLGR